VVVRILLVTTWYPSTLAPSSGIFVQKDVELLRRNHEVQVIHLISPDLVTQGDRSEVDDEVVRIPMSTSNPRQIARAWNRILPFFENADVLHTQAFSALLPFAGRRVRLPWVHTEHWSGLSTPSTLPRTWRVLLPSLKRLLRMPDVVTAVCEYLAEPIRSARPGAVRIVPCNVQPVGIVKPPPREPDHLNLIAVGGLLDRKDPLCAVETVGMLRERGVPAALTWVGEGELRAVVEARISELGLEHEVELVGSLDSMGVGMALDRSDIFFLPTRGENFCVSAAEALVHGRPVVVGSTGGQGEYIRPEAGALVSVQTPSAYADAVEDLAARTQATTALEIAATIGDRFSSESVLRGYEAAYAEATSTR
jgi:glycosyltransferase involved in cell wall biosynthesis